MKACETKKVALAVHSFPLFFVPLLKISLKMPMFLSLTAPLKVTRIIWGVCSGFRLPGMRVPSTEQKHPSDKMQVWSSQRTAPLGSSSGAKNKRCCFIKRILFCSKNKTISII